MIRLLLALLLAISPALAQQGTIVGPLPTATGTAATGQIPGTTTNDAAAAGKVGETISSSVALGSAVSLSDATVASITNITLTAGNWQLCGQVSYVTGATTNITYLWGSVSTANNTVNSSNGTWSGWQFGTGLVVNAAALGVMSLSLTCTTVSLSGNQQYFLNTKQSFSVSTLSGWGYIYGVRIR